MKAEVAENAENIMLTAPTVSEGSTNDWQTDLERDGFAVVKGAIPRERADAYADRLWTYLEDL